MRKKKKKKQPCDHGETVGMSEALMHGSTHTHTGSSERTQTHYAKLAYARDTQVHRLTALSKKRFTEGSFLFFFPPDRLINSAQVVPHLLGHV